jgi:hypothetical protein
MNLENYFCDGQMSFDECLREMEDYKWKTGQYMNLPETEENMNIVDYIPSGYSNAISRKDLCRITGLTDRVMRNMIEEARRETIIISNNDGSGYWLYPTDPTKEEKLMLEKYVKQQESRAKSIFYALRPARQKMKGVSENAE